MAQAQLEWSFRYPDDPYYPNMMYKGVGTTFEEATEDHPKGAMQMSRAWPSHAWPGMYPLYYVTKDGGCLCPRCANKEINLTLSDDPQWRIEQVDINYEDPTLYCDNCSEMIEPANGE